MVTRAGLADALFKTKPTTPTRSIRCVMNQCAEVTFSRVALYNDRYATSLRNQPLYGQSCFGDSSFRCPVDSKPSVEDCATISHSVRRMDEENFDVKNRSYEYDLRRTKLSLETGQGDQLWWCSQRSPNPKRDRLLREATTPRHPGKEIGWTDDWHEDDLRAESNIHL